jgi:hypothetical protein
LGGDGGNLGGTVVTGVENTHISGSLRDRSIVPNEEVKGSNPIHGNDVHGEPICMQRPLVLLWLFISMQQSPSPFASAHPRMFAAWRVAADASTANVSVVFE